MNPVIQKYLEEVELLKSSIALKKASQTKRRDHPIGIYYDEDGKVIAKFITVCYRPIGSLLTRSSPIR